MWRMTRCLMSTPRRGGVYWRRRSLNPSPSTSLLQTLPSPSFGCSSAPASDSSISFMDFSDGNETVFSMRRISRLITNTLRWSLFWSISNFAIFKKAILFQVLIQLLPPPVGLLRQDWKRLHRFTLPRLVPAYWRYVKNQLLLREYELSHVFQDLRLVTLVHRICHRYYRALDFFQVVVKVGIQSINDLNERVF